MSKLSTASEKKLIGVKKTLVRVVQDAASICKVPFIVVEGVRSAERQLELYAKGRTVPGKIVTHTLRSKHITGEAVDLAPITANGAIDWNDIDAFKEIGRAMMLASMRVYIPIRWGYDWDGDGILQEKGEYDGPHFELIQ